MTGWAGFIESARPDPGQGKTLDEALRGNGGRSWYDAAGDPESADLDEHQANLLARGYNAGHLSQLSSRLAEAQAALQGIQEKNEAARKRQARIARDHQAGRISAGDIMRMDFDEPDQAAEDRLERRVSSLQGQLRDAAALIAPQREPHPVEAAVNRARKVSAELAREAAAEPLPFGQPECADCRAAGATRSESAAIHAQAEIRRSEAAGDANPYRAQGSYDASEIVRGTESAIVRLR